MTTELFYLALTSLLLASLWIPYIVGVNKYATTETLDFSKSPNKRNLPNWVQRADRAHVNLVEQFAPYAILLLLADQLEISNIYTVWAAALFFWLRVAHAVGMITGLAGFPIRPIIFTTAWACIVVIGVNVLLA